MRPGKYIYFTYSCITYAIWRLELILLPLNIISKISVGQCKFLTVMQAEIFQCKTCIKVNQAGLQLIPLIISRSFNKVEPLTIWVVFSNVALKRVKKMFPSASNQNACSSFVIQSPGKVHKSVASNLKNWKLLFSTCPFFGATRLRITTSTVAHRADLNFLAYQVQELEARSLPFASSSI